MLADGKGDEEHLRGREELEPAHQLRVVQPVVERARVRDRYTTRGLLLCYLVLPSTTTTIFESFLCDDGFGTDTAYLVADYDIEYGCQLQLVIFSLLKS